LHREKGIPRYIPKEVSKLLLQYLTYVRPIEILFAETFDLPGAESLRLYLFSDPMHREPWSGDRFCLYFRQITNEWLGRPLGVSSYRQAAIALARWHLMRYLILDQDVNILDLQGSHGSRVANEHYGVQMGSHTEIPQDVAFKFEKISNLRVNLILLLQSPLFASPEQTRCGPAPSLLSSSSEDAETQKTSMPPIHRCLQYVNHQMRDIVRATFGPEGTFRSRGQRWGLSAALSRERDVLVVLPTGGGKTLLITGPPMVEGGLATAVFVPLIVLKHQLNARCEALGMIHRVWDRHNPPVSPPQILIASPEDCGDTESLAGYLKALYASERLGRIVVDECHVPDAHRIFRPVMDVLVKLRTSQIPVPLLLLSATVPPHAVPKLKELYCTVDLEIIREDTERTNISYRVEIKPTFKEVLARMTEVVRNRNTLVEEGDRGIIYCANAYLARDLHDHLTTVFGETSTLYLGDFSDKERKSSEERWRGGRCLWIIATTAFGMGVDHGRVRAVVHFGQARSLLDYRQETGRASRDGQPGTCLTITSLDFVARHLSRENFPGSEVSMLTSFLFDTSTCRAKFLGEHFDGAGIKCAKDRRSLCDNCKHPLLSRTRTEIRRR
jgi:superfamily II DNA or RNA helicase